MKIEKIDEALTTIVKMEIISLLVLLNIEQSQMGYLFITMLADSLAGVVRTVRLNESLSFSTFIWGILSKILIITVPMILAAFGMVFKLDLIWLVKIVLYTIAVNDLISILASILSIKTRKKYKSVDFIEKIISAIIKMFSNMAEKALHNIKNEDKPENN